jgi:hypothetical protein
VEFTGEKPDEDAPVPTLIEKLQRLQPFNFFEDTFITPRRRANELSEYLDVLEERVSAAQAEVAKASKLAEEALAEAESDTAEGTDNGSVDLEDIWWETEAESKISEARFAAKDALNRKLKINRHIKADVEKPENRVFQDIEYRLEALGDSVMDGASFESVDNELSAIAGTVDSLAKVYPEYTAWQGVGLAGKAFVTSTFFSEHYIREYESEMEDVSIFANNIRPWMQFFQYMIMEDAGPKALAGKDGWMFFKPGFDYLVRPSIYDKRSKLVDANDGTNKAFKDDPISTMVDMRDQLNERGIDLLMVVIPGKPAVYPDYISPSYGVEDACMLSHSVELIERMREAGLDVVDLFGPFAEARKNDEEAGDKLYLATDTHWKARGLKIAAEEVAKRIRQYPWYEDGDTEYRVEKLKVMREGDVGTMSQLPDFVVRDLGMGFPLEETKCFQVHQVVRDGEGNVKYERPYKDDYSSDTKIMLLGDSFSRIYQTDEPRSAGWISHLALHLKQPLSTIVNDGGASTLVRETLDRKIDEANRKGRPTLLDGKKLVVWEFIERDFRFGAEGWKHIDL